MEKLKKFIIHFLRRLCKIIPFFIGALIVLLIYGITYEPGTKHIATKRKCKRIRVLTKFKLYLYKYCWWYFDFIHDTYFKKLYNKFGFLINKK